MNRSLEDRLTVEIDVDPSVLEEDAKDMKKFDLKILAASSESFELKCTFKKPFLF